MRFADQEELANRQKRRVQKRRNEIIWNILTAVVLVATVTLVAFFLVIYSNPRLALNPYPPPTMPVLVVLSTSTSTPVRLPATWTPTPKPTETLKPTSTSTTEPTATQPSATPKPTTAVPTAYPTTDNGAYPFAIEGQPVGMANTVFHPDYTCQWQGVAGKVVDLQGAHLPGMLIKLTGTYDGRTIDLTTQSGRASAWYGDSGYEFVLGKKPVDSRGTLAVQILDQSLRPLSARVVFDSYSTCDMNLTIINFKQVR